MTGYDPTAIVTSFFAEWDKDRDRFFASFRTYLSDDVVWDNVGLARADGIDQVMALMAEFEKNLGMKTMKVDVLAIAAAGNKVLTERIDHVLDAAGKEVMAIPLMGILELDGDGRISRWSDYFDTTPFKA